MSHSIDVSQQQEPATHTTEVVPPAKKKRYSAAYKLRIIDQADRCTAPGELGAFLRREGIYFTTLTDFRKQKARGDFDPKRAAAVCQDQEVAPPKLVKELATAEREVRRLRRELQRATALLDLQKKVSEILGLTLSESE